MDVVARLSKKDREELFLETAHRKGIHPIIIEKDFWVCWVLKHLFATHRYGKKLILKGGTSLSKVYDVISRFSEDIDLILDWRVLNISSEEINERRSKTKQDRLNKLINRKAAEFIRDDFIPALQAEFDQEGIEDLKIQKDLQDPHNVEVLYPAQTLQHGYIEPKVLLEIGPLAAWEPHTEKEIKPYAADYFSQVFHDPVCPVKVTAAERTFWEKATILHQEAHRSQKQARRDPPQRYSRHYYDLFMLSHTDIRKSALDNSRLLQNVVEFKKKFYPSAWANYETATPGTFKLLPQDTEVLTADYRKMQDMIFGESPDFDTIMTGLAELEKEINYT